MNDPSVTGSVRAVVEKHGALMVVLFFLRTYWKQVGGFISAIFVVGMFYQQFRSMQGSVDALTAAVKTQDEHIQRQEGHLQAIDANIVSIKDKQITQESRWNTVTTEAAIVITPKAKPRKK